MIKTYLQHLLILSGLTIVMLPTDHAYADARSLLNALDDTARPPREPGPDSVVFSDDILIDAPVETIWEILVDLDRYAEWNPWVYKAEGDAVVGGVAHVTVTLNGLPFNAKHVVLTAVPNSSFCWRDAGWNAGFVYGQRCRKLTVQDSGEVLVENVLLIDGKLSGVAAKIQGKSLKDGMHKELQALKSRAEEGF